MGRRNITGRGVTVCEVRVTRRRRVRERVRRNALRREALLLGEYWLLAPELVGRGKRAGKKT